MRYLVITLILCSMLSVGVASADGALDQWPPREYLIDSILDHIPRIMDSYKPETGHFGGTPWIVNDQNVLFPLAAAWSLDHPDNPYYHDDKVLKMIGQGGVALVEAQDDAGRWRFDKRDGSYWGQIHMPWTYSRWIRAYDLVGDALPDDVRETWEEGLKLGFRVMAQHYPDSHVHNIPTHRAMALYIAGECFDNDDWKQRARQFMAKVVERQDPVGFWSENFGPVISYNFVYSDSLGIYYAYSKDPVVLDALERAAHFHSATLWPDGTAVPCIDERVIYHDGIRIGNPGFAHTPEGRGYLLAQMRRHAGENMSLIGADAAAALLLYGTDGQVAMPGDMAEDGIVTLGDNDALIRRGDTLPEGRADDWSWAFSAYATPPPDSRWIQDRHNLVDVFHADLGLLAGGGNTKLQPWWSTFTLGDPSLLSHTPGETHPDFTPDIELAWTPADASISRDGDLTRLDVVMQQRQRFNREPVVTQDFEQTATGQLPADWTVDYGQADQMRVSAEAAHQGEQALWLADDSDTDSLGLRSPQVPAEPGEVFFAEAWWLGEKENNAAIYIEFWDEEGRLEDGVKAYQCPGTGEWTKYEGNLEAPEDTVAATVLIYLGQSSIGEGYFDDVVLGRLVPEKQERDRAECSVEVRTEGEDLLLTYRAPAGAGVQAHLPLMVHGRTLVLADGEKLPVVDRPLILDRDRTGEAIVHGDLRLTVPPGAHLRWPARQHNPYKRDGSSSLGNAKLVLVMPFEETGEYTVRFSKVQRPPFEGIAFEARDLPVEHSEGTYIKRLDNLGSQFIGDTENGDWLRFTLPEVEAGRYELLGDFVLAHSYGIVEVLVDGEVVGEPFDGYWPAVDASGTIQSFGEVELDDGPHTVTIRIIGKNEDATARIFSVKRWLLRPLD